MLLEVEVKGKEVRAKWTMQVRLKVLIASLMITCCWTLLLWVKSIRGLTPMV